MKKHLFFACVFLVFAGCEKRSEINTFPSELEAIVPINKSIIGSWVFSAVFYGSELIMKENGTFEYYYQGLRARPLRQEPGKTWVMGIY